MNEGNLQEPPMPSLNLIVVDYKGRELDLVMEQASHEFLSDDNFVKSRAFYQFAWRSNIGRFDEGCNKLKSEHLEIEDVAIQSEIKDEMFQELQNLTPKEGREMVRTSNVLLLPNWDTTNALVFNSISNKLDILDRNKQEVKNASFNVDQDTLLIWLIRKGSKIISS